MTGLGAPIDAALVHRLVADQFPDWAELPVRAVADDGWDNRTFHLGPDLLVRLPSAEGYASQVPKEQRWLPVLAPRLPLPIPAPVGYGKAGDGYPFAWSVYRWIPGEIADRDTVADLDAFAASLASFLLALQRIPTDGAPPAGPHSAHRGGPLGHYDADFRDALSALGDRVPASDCLALWDDALARPHRGVPVWFHGDVAIGNLLVRQGTLAAVIDFGCAGVGDPACDLAIAWTLLPAQSRSAFRARLAADDDLWRRGRAWALWKALITMARDEPDGRRVRLAQRTLAELLSEADAASDSG